MVFQNYALFPHLNVFHNIAYGAEDQEAEPE
jgi:ABC-type Fe3+/spermidine/putrescine transport system ATPase subunit